MMKIRNSENKQQKKVNAPLSEKTVLFGVTLSASETWIRVSQNGKVEEVRSNNLKDKEIKPDSRDIIYRAFEYDKGQRFSGKLRGRALRDAMLHSLEFMPVYKRIDGICWYTDSERSSYSDYPVYSLGAALWSYSKKKKLRPADGILYTFCFPVENSVIWVFFGIGRQGSAAVQAARTSSSTDEPVFNHQAMVGIIGENYTKEVISIPDFVSYLVKDKPGKYPQRTEIGGISKTRLGKAVFSFGSVLVMLGATTFLWTGHQLSTVKEKGVTLSARYASLTSNQKDFYIHNLLGVIGKNSIHLGKDLQTADQLWKPGTTVSLYDGFPYSTAASGPALLRRPNSVSQHGSQGVLFTVSVPETHSAGFGQTYWVSHAILNSVIKQRLPKGVSLQSINPGSGGEDYVVIFSR